MQKLSVIAFRKHVLVIALSLCTFLLCATAASAAWSGPPAGTPPNNCTTGYPGCDAPINISGTAQSKQAGLLLNTQGAANGLLMYGNLGVGTLTPASRLTVVGDIRASTGGSLLFDTAAGNTRGYLKAVEAGVDGGAAGGAGLILATSGGEGIAIKGGGTSGTTFMAIAGNGNVGIGTASPGTTRLNVQKSGDGEWAGIIANTMNSGGPKGLLVLTGQNGSNAALQVANNTLAAPIPVFTVTGGGSATLNGQMNAASYCIAGANCITAWPSAVAEADTLATVVARGNSTTNAIAVANITDSNNNNYYIDPNNTSVFNDIRSTQARSSVWYDNDNTNYTIDPTGISRLNDIRPSIIYDGDNTNYYVDPHNVSVLNDVRANIFYDLGNTDYRVDPNGTSVFSTICFGSDCKSAWPSGGSSKVVGGMYSVYSGGGSACYMGNPLSSNWTGAFGSGCDCSVAGMPSMTGRPFAWDLDDNSQSDGTSYHLYFCHN